MPAGVVPLYSRSCSTTILSTKSTITKILALPLTPAPAISADLATCNTVARAQRCLQSRLQSLPWACLHNWACMDGTKQSGHGRLPQSLLSRHRLLLQVAIPYAATELPTALSMDARLLLQPRLLIPQQSKVEALGVVAPASEKYTQPSSILDTIDTCEVKNFQLPAPSSSHVEDQLVSGGVGGGLQAWMLCSSRYAKSQGFTVACRAWCI